MRGSGVAGGQSVRIARETRTPWTHRCEPTSCDTGQMAVELAVLMPVALVVALVVFNLCRFIQLCAVFDRVSYDAMASIGTSPSGELSTASAADQIASRVRETLGHDDLCSVEVRAEAVSSGGSQAVFVISPLLTRYTCELSYRPWPSSVVIAGVSAGTPLALHHERSLVVDRFRSGVVM